jgi:1-acyl-sn-glycerol-3-phosphate acyltransferase
MEEPRWVEPGAEGRHGPFRCLLVHATIWGGVLLFGPIAIVLSPFTRGEIVIWLGRIWTWAIFKAVGARLEVEGMENFRPGLPYVLVPNHGSNFDVYGLILAIRSRRYRFLCKKEVLYLPIFGWALWAGGFPFVDRGNNPRARRSLKRLAERMKRTGLSIITFPEGTRNKTDAVLRPFKKGPFVLAIDLKAPLLPVSIHGARAIQSRRAFWFRPGTVRIVFHPPISTEGLTYDDRDRLKEETRRVLLEALARTEGAPVPRETRP